MSGAWNQQDERVLRDLDKYDRLADAMGQSAAEAFQFGYEIEFDHALINGRHKRLLRDLEAGIVPPFPVPQRRERGILLGANSSGNPIRVQPEWLLSNHLLMVGSTGAAKTSLLFQLLTQLLPVIGGLLAVDVYKRTLRGLLSVARHLGLQLTVVRAHDDRWNLLDPAGLEPRTHMQLVVGLLARVLDLPGLARTVVQNAIFDLYTERGVFAGAGTPPHLFDLFERVRGMSDVNHAARESLLSRLASLLVSITPAVGAWSRGWRPQDLENRLVVLELQSAGEWHRSLRVASALLHQMYLRNQQGRGAPLLFVFDDAMSMLHGGGSELTPLGEALGLVRSAGLSFWGLCQSVQRIDPGLISNCNNKVVGRLGAAADWQALGRELFLDPRQMAWARAGLQPGTYLAQFAAGYRGAFPFTIPHLPLPTAPTDSEVVESQRGLRALPTVFDTRFESWTPRPKAEVRTPAPEPSSRLTPEELRVLRCVAEHPAVSSSQLPPLCSMAPRRFRGFRERLVREGYLVERKLQTSATGRPSIVLVLTPSGIDALGGA